MTNPETHAYPGLLRAHETRKSFHVRGEVYLLGSLERGVTIYGQQVRAHNLAWALWRSRAGSRYDKIAVVGGGIAGLTAAACCLGLQEGAELTLIERHWDFCAFQQGSDIRWVHPRIYDWPEPGSRAPSASLPVLNWQAGRASDVAHQILTAFGGFVNRRGPFSAFLGASSVSIDSARGRISWTGAPALREGAYFRPGDIGSWTKEFDLIIVAAGFGLEVVPPQFATPSYWRNEPYGQPVFDGKQAMFLVSGYGDGAIVDLCRLAIGRFRQDRILDELFGDRLVEAEKELLPLARQDLTGRAFYDALDCALGNGTLGTKLHDELAKRIRRDTKVILQASGSGSPANSGFHQLMLPTTSFANRVLLYLLHQIGAFELTFDMLEAAVARYGVPTKNVICRHGPATLDTIRSVFVDPSSISGRLQELARTQAQVTTRLWDAGCFPPH